MQHRNCQWRRRQIETLSEGKGHFCRNWPLNQGISTCFPRMSDGQFAWTLIIQKCPFSFSYAPMSLPVILKYQGFLPGYPFCNNSLVLCSPLLLSQLPFSVLGPFRSYIFCSPLAWPVVYLWSCLALTNSSDRLRIPALRSAILMLDYVSSNCVSGE